MSITAGCELAGPRDAGPGPRTLFLLEDQPDHAALIGEALRNALPGVRVSSSAGEKPEDRVERPDVLLVALSADLEEARQRISLGVQAQPGVFVVLLRGPNDRWQPADLRQTRSFPVLDKRGGSLFLERLAEVVRDALLGREAAATAAGSPIESRTAPVPGDAPSRGEAQPALRGRRTPSRAGRDSGLVEVLAGEIELLLSGAVTLAELHRGRFPADPPARTYAAHLQQELGKARAVTARLRAIAGAGRPSQAVRVTPAQVLVLRGPAWRVFAPGGVAVVVDAADPGPEIEIHGEIFGAAIDDLVGELLSAASPAERVSIDCGVAIADEIFCAARPGLHRGRCARVRGWIQAADISSGEQRSVDAACMNRTQLRALAAIKAHDGFLELTASKADRLSQFEVLVPAAPPRGPAATRETSARPAGVLFVDDDEAVRGGSLEMLRAAGFAADGAASGAEALAFIASGHRYDTILLDLNLPGLSGADTFEEIRAIDPQARVVLVSGSAADEVLRELFDQGLWGFVPKPFSMRQLIDAVRAALGAVV